MKQTAVEWLILEMNKTGFIFDKTDLSIFDQAKELEKQQIIDANNRGFRVAKRNIAENALDYYNETFKAK